MLPFLKNKSKAAQTGVIVKHREPDNKVDYDSLDHNDPTAILEACAADFISAIHSRDSQKLAQVLKDTFELLDAMPHVEGEHIESKEI